MNKKLCHDCIYKEIATEFGAFNDFDQYALNLRHQREFSAWFKKLFNIPRGFTTGEKHLDCVPCWKAEIWAHGEDYKLASFFTTTYWYDYVTSPPDNCPYLLEHTLTEKEVCVNE